MDKENKSNEKFMTLLKGMSDENKKQFFRHIGDAYNLMEAQFGADNFSKWLEYFCDNEWLTALFCMYNAASGVYWEVAKREEGIQ